MVIVYRSNTGFTKEYAEMLGRSEKRKFLPLDRARQELAPNTPVFYMGPLMAGHITGIDQAVKAFQVKGVCGVGLSPTSQHVLDTLTKANYVPNAPIFYLQGGWAPKKVGWIKRRMVSMVTRSMRDTLRDKGSRRTPQEQKQLDVMEKGGSFVAFENLEAIRAWMKEQG